MKSPQEIFTSFLKTIDKDEVILFITTFIIGILAYYSMSSNWLTNPDGIYHTMVYKYEFSSEYYYGRPRNTITNITFEFKCDFQCHICLLFSIYSFYYYYTNL